MIDSSPWLAALPPPLRPLAWRAHPLDGKLLLFERERGLNVLLEGPETAVFVRQAPRSLLIAVTNACNLACPFCYRDQSLASAWRAETLLAFCREAAEWGVLEAAFGGGEPLVFPGWARLICQLHDETPLAISFTTNGTLLSAPFLREIAGRYGQIRLSLYDDNGWPDSLRLLARSGARFGVNWLITPAGLPELARRCAELVALGTRDIVLLRYKGPDRRLHCSPSECRRLAALIGELAARWGGRVAFKVDGCWGGALDGLPRLLPGDDCGAGDEIISVTSARTLKACSFGPGGVPFETIDDVRRFWQAQRARRPAVAIGGCGRLPTGGFVPSGGGIDARIALAPMEQ